MCEVQGYEEGGELRHVRGSCLVILRPPRILASTAFLYPAASLSFQGEQAGMITDYLRLEAGRDRLEVGLGKGGCVMYSKERDRGGGGAQSYVASPGPVCLVL